MSEKENIREIILIGRDRDCNFICNDTSVSRHHAQIIDYGTSCSVVDLGSTNGTFVNGRKVSSETTLHAGDGLRVGNVDVPWQQLVQPPQEPKSNKRLLWILIPIVAALLIGGGLAVYFVYGHAKDKDEKAEEVQSEIIGELANQITENEKQAIKLDSISNSAEKKIDSLNKATEQAEKRAKEADAKATRKESEANLRIGEANEKINVANEKLNEAEEKLNEAEEKQTEAHEKLDNANKMLDTVGKKLDSVRLVLIKTESIREEKVIKAIDELEEDDAKAICRELKIEFNVRLAAKEALKKEFITSGDVRRQEIGKALKEKQKNSNKQ